MTAEQAKEIILQELKNDMPTPLRNAMNMAVTALGVWDHYQDIEYDYKKQGEMLGGLITYYRKAMENVMDNSKAWKPGELIIYQNGDRFEIGKIKRITDDGAFVWYHEGETAAKTPFDCMHKLINAYTILKDSLGGEGGVGISSY